MAVNLVNPNFDALEGFVSSELDQSFEGYTEGGLFGDVFTLKFCSYGATSPEEAEELCSQVEEYAVNVAGFVSAFCSFEALKRDYKKRLRYEAELWLSSRPLAGCGYKPRYGARDLTPAQKEAERDLAKKEGRLNYLLRKIT